MHYTFLPVTHWELIDSSPNQNWILKMREQTVNFGRICLRYCTNDSLQLWNDSSWGFRLYVQIRQVKLFPYRFWTTSVRLYIVYITWASQRIYCWNQYCSVLPSEWERKKNQKFYEIFLFYWNAYCIKICFITVRCAHLKSNQYWISWQYQKHFTAIKKEKYKRIDTGSWKHHWLLTLRECHCASGEKMLFTKMKKRRLTLIGCSDQMNSP